MLELDTGSLVDLFQEMEQRLSARHAAASLYIVGGAALLMTHGRRTATPDVDVARTVQSIDEVAKEIAHERGLAMNWLNSNAQPWIPPRPTCAFSARNGTGLTVHLAPIRHLLAMKLVAWRPKDEEDLIELIEACGLRAASPEQIADLLYDVYTVEDSLPLLLSVPRATDEEVRAEAIARAVAALALT